MLELTVWKNQELDNLRRDIDRLFDRLWSDFGISVLPGEFVRGSAVHMSENTTTLFVNVEIPGMDASSLSVTVFKELLIIRGDKRSQVVGEGAGRRTERRFGSFTRRIQLPCRVVEEETEATFSNGLLRIIMPKQLAPRSSRIRIQVA